jgi:hypothetical protein
MQNIVILAGIDRLALVPHLGHDHILRAMDDLLEGTILTENITLFQQACAG